MIEYLRHKSINAANGFSQVYILMTRMPVTTSFIVLIRSSVLEAVFNRSLEKIWAIQPGLISSKYITTIWFIHIKSNWSKCYVLWVMTKCTLQWNVENHCSQSDKARRSDNKIKVRGRYKCLKWRYPKVIKIQSGSIEAVDIVRHQINNLSDTRLLSENSLAQ